MRPAKQKSVCRPTALPCYTLPLARSPFHPPHRPASPVGPRLSLPAGARKIARGAEFPATSLLGFRNFTSTQREEPMNGKHVGTALAALVATTALVTPALAQNEQFIPQLVYCTGAY